MEDDEHSRDVNPRTREPGRAHMRVTLSNAALRDSIAYTPAAKFQGGAKKRPRWNRLIVAATVAALVVGGGAPMLNRQLNSPLS
jgi:hypothetical protein